MILFKKKIEDKKELEFDELESFVTTKLEKESEETISKVNVIINEISSILTSIRMIGKEIEEIKLDKQQIATNYINTVNNTKHNLLSIMMNITEIPNVNNPNDLDDTKRYVSSVLTKLGSVTGSHRRIIYEFFPSQAKRLKSKLEALTTCNQQLNLIIDDYNNKVVIFNDIKEKISVITKAKEELLQMHEKKKELELKIKEIMEKQDFIIKELDHTKQDKEYIKDKMILSNAIYEHKSLLHQLDQLFSNIVKAIHKYDYTIGIKKDMKNILAKINNPSSISNEETILLISLLNDIIKAIKNVKIELKNPEKNIANIETLIKTLPTYITKIRSYEQMINDFTNKVRSFEDKIISLEDKVNTLRTDLELLNNKYKEYSNRINELNTLIDNNINGIKSDLEKIMINIIFKY